MHVHLSRENLLSLTSAWTGDRFPDGRPKVPDEVLASLRAVTSEQLWAVLFERGYERQFEGNWLQTHPGRPLVGRAVTAQFVPHRPDHDQVVTEASTKEGRVTERDRHNWMLVESLQRDDVMVVDIFGKIYEGTVVGDKLGTAVAARTGAGAVIDGGIRDLDGIQQLEDVNIFYRGTDPTPIRNVTLAGMNTAVRIGGATVLPGDVVIGTMTGVTFVPPHLAAEAAEAANDTSHRDEFGKLRLREGVYATSDIDLEVWAPAIEEDYVAWLGGQRPSDAE